MERQTSLFLIGVALFVCSATVFGQSVFVADFIEHRVNGMESLDYGAHGYARGKVYYKYVEKCTKPASGVPWCIAKADRTESRLLFQYQIGSETIKDLYHYGDGAMYSMCSSSCSGILLTHKADPWFPNASYYTKDRNMGNGFFWFNRTTYGTSNTYSMTTEIVSPQVSRILANEKNWGDSDFRIKTIEFDDHRVVDFDIDTEKFETGHDNDFSTNPSLNCPKATCPIYADLIFVLDNSGSVDSNEWKQTVTFVKNVIDTFTFGEDGANAAVIQFNAPYTYNCKTRYVGSCSRYYQDCSFKSCSSSSTCTNAYPGRDTATLIAGRNVGGTINEISVSPDPFSIKSNLTTKPKCYGNTCQGFGLELAIKVLENSPRRRYGNKPHPIVIAVTDGVDFCPNKTYNAAEKLRRDYDALVIEVGVGISTGTCGPYDVDFLKRSASQIGDVSNRAYYDVKNYNAIKELSEKLFKPICVGMDGACGPDCYGFCGCGKCFCPTCEISNSSCYDYECKADATSSTGCKKVVHYCPEGNLPNDTCHKYECLGDVQGSGRCRPLSLDEICKDVKSVYSGKCHDIRCDNMRGCYVYDFDHDYCNDVYGGGDKCYKYECAQDMTLPGIDKESGCRLLRNYTAEKEAELIANKKIKCFVPFCNSSTGKTDEVDACSVLKDDNSEYSSSCYNYECLEKEGDYECQTVSSKFTGEKEETGCARFVCNGTGGWVPEYKDRNCTKELLDNNVFRPDEVSCMNAYCPAEKDDCTYINYTATQNCDPWCVKEIIEHCLDVADEISSKHRCYPVKCSVYKNLDNSKYGQCNYEHDPKEVAYVDCADKAELVAKVDERSSAINTSECCTVTCAHGGVCDYECVNKSSMPDISSDVCHVYACVKQSKGVWEWKAVASKLALSCHELDNPCWAYGCDAKDGCVPETEVCASQTNECYNFTCLNFTKEGDKVLNLTCQNESLLDRTTCAKEVCVKGKKKVVEDIEACNLTLEFKCLERRCAYYEPKNGSSIGESECIYTPKEEPTDDDCSIYICDNNTGNFTPYPKCVDDDLCTDDVCNVLGQCRYPVITCEELKMENYPCYYRQCIPDPVNNKYMCRRRHIKGAMIDLCGNCILEKDEAGPIVTSDSMLKDSKYVEPVVSSSSSSVSLISCTMAGPRPLLTEGLAAASIALIIIGAVVIGAGITASSVLGTRELIRRARGANNQSAHTNPLFQENEAEMNNPAFIEEKDG